MEKKLKVAVIGAGISGLACARELTKSGFSVTVIEKSRGVGGRTATRRLEDGVEADHGAQFITITDESFAERMKEWLKAGVVTLWPGRVAAYDGNAFHSLEGGVQFFVGTPRMTSLAKHLAEGSEVLLSTKVKMLESEGSGWMIETEERGALGPFDWVVTSAPAAQSAVLCETAPDMASEMVRAMESVRMLPCWSLICTFDSPVSAPWDGFFAPEETLSWACRNSSKPERPNTWDTWVLHGAPAWSEKNLELPGEAVAEQLLEVFWKMLKVPPIATKQVSTHRWRYSLPSPPLEQTFLWDPLLGLGACGDWLGGPKVEGAYLSGHALALQMKKASTWSTSIH